MDSVPQEDPANRSEPPVKPFDNAQVISILYMLITIDQFFNDQQVELMGQAYHAKGYWQKRNLVDDVDVNAFSWPVRHQTDLGSSPRKKRDCE
jgi:hypothetical protein